MQYDIDGISEADFYYDYEKYKRSGMIYVETIKLSPIYLELMS